jgi:hypothetical protein
LKEDILNISLPKWPFLTVEGDDITTDQAGEILIRTNSYPVYTNDEKWLNIVEKILGYPKSDDNNLKKFVDAVDNFYKKFSIINIEYLNNNRIASSYIGGPHGWCNWDGKIFCNNYNIGKYPNAITVFEEWALIATIFPYLNLRAQLWSGEHCEDGIYPVIEYLISNGNVDILTKNLNPMKISEWDLNFPPHERGCSKSQLEYAVNLIIKGIS